MFVCLFVFLNRKVVLVNCRLSMSQEQNVVATSMNAARGFNNRCSTSGMRDLMTAQSTVQGQSCSERMVCGLEYHRIYSYVPYSSLKYVFHFLVNRLLKTH